MEGFLRDQIIEDESISLDERKVVIQSEKLDYKLASLAIMLSSLRLVLGSEFLLDFLLGIVLRTFDSLLKLSLVELQSHCLFLLLLSLGDGLGLAFLFLWSWSRLL